MTPSPDHCGLYGPRSSRALAWLQAEQVPSATQRLVYAADLRYAHQSFELTCPMPTGHMTQALVQELMAAFHHRSRRLYSYDLPNALVQLS